MKFHGVIFIFVFILLVSLVSAAKVEEEVLTAFEHNPEVKVIVQLKEPTSSLGINSEQDKKYLREEKENKVLGKLKIKKKESIGINSDSYDLELNHQYDLLSGFSGSLTKQGLQKLEHDPEVETIFLNRVLSPTLTTSVPQINANQVWNLSINGYNITGAGETICVIDTGIDTDHSAFTGRILGQYCYCSVTDYGAGGCCPDNTTESTSAEDGQGHGTHVTGIAVGNYSTYRGVAPAAGIISIKVCNNAASASCNTDDVIAAIQWCTNNVSLFNISVISMSLGGGGPYNSYCNSDSIAPAINGAVAKNISVVVSAGNSGYTD